MAIFFMLNRAYVEGMCTSESMQYEVCHISRPGGIFSTREVPLPYVIPCPCPRRKVNQIPWLYDFHGDPVVKNLPANAVDKRSTPGWGTKVPYAVGPLSPHATITEPIYSGAPQLEKSQHTTTKTQGSPIN